MLNRVRLWVRSAVLRRRLEREMQEEMTSHLERSAERLMARGLTAEQARREAEREFGNVVYLQEQARDARGTAWLDALVADVRFAQRHFARRPLTTVVMLVVLAVGMSISTLLFSYVHSYAVQPPPAVDLEDDLVRLRGSQSAGRYGRGTRGFSAEELHAYRQLTEHFAAVAGWTTSPVLLDAGADPGLRGLDARATFVTPDYFDVLGVRPVLGPGLPGGESAATANDVAAVLAHRAWDEVFGRDPDVIGRSISVNGVAATIVGVAPERFVGVSGFGRLQLWLPLGSRTQVVRQAPAWLGAADEVQYPVDFRAAGRLRPGVTAEAATAAVQVVARAHAAARVNPDVRDASTEVVPLLSANGDPNFDSDVRLMSVSVGLLGLLVLLVTCTNVSALLTGMALARRQEIAVRLSLGAGRRRVVRQLLTETALLALFAGTAALAIVGLVLRRIDQAVPDLPLVLRITWPATIFTFGVALAVGIVFGLSPALHATRLALAGVLRDSAASVAAARARLQRGLVVAQIAFTQPLIVLLAAVLLLVIGRFQPQVRTESGDRIITLSLRAMAPTARTAEAAAEARHRLTRTTYDLLDRLQTTPGIQAAVVQWGGASSFGTYVSDAADQIPESSRAPIALTAERAAAGYLELMGLPLVRGRTFRPDDVAAGGAGATELPAVIGADLARRLWPRGDPVGRRLVTASDSAPAAALRVIGVVEDPATGSRRAGDEYRIFLPADTTRPAGALLVRTTAAAAVMIPTIRQIVHEQAPGTSVGLRILSEIEAEQARNFRMMAGGVTAAGMLALLLSALGLYAVIAFAVGQRTREIAVRIAVGGRSRQIVNRFVLDGVRLGAIGLAFGLPISILGLRLLMTDPDVPYVPLPQVTTMAAAGVAIVAAAAAWLPARRAAAIDPAITLRAE